MNGFEELAMRKRILEKEIGSAKKRTLLEIGWIQYVVRQVLGRCREKDPDGPVKYLDNLDKAAAYTTPEEMAELLERWQELQSNPKAGTLTVVGYCIDSDYKIRETVTDILKCYRA